MLIFKYINVTIVFQEPRKMLPGKLNNELDHDTKIHALTL